MSIDSGVEGGVCTCMWEGRSDQWRFPLLSSAQQQMGRGCGLVGWVTRIMNLPVVLFNTWKKENENRNTCGKVGSSFVKKKSPNKQPGGKLVLHETAPHLSQQSLVTFWGSWGQKKPHHGDGAYFCQPCDVPADARCLQSQLLRNKLVLFTFESLPQWAHARVLLRDVERGSHPPHSYMCTPG